MTKQISVKYNEEELKTHEWIKEFLGITGTFGADSSTVKMAEEGLKNVLLGLFGPKLTAIFRRKYSLDKAIKGLETTQNDDKVIP